ncbi:PTS N-acetylglucosamine transporter subunit IIBC [Lactobacillus sp. DCY120]|uniref:PTS N-acetylglucosamine transporter subunit IIBC n=1 Tax=Bombilactobacillus apium TaxID=2675299 RepID=A0A850QW36_9LACO|nr:PTS N-acetylglucosamine transporter subunit IIBC [Bombilactobacillus apium]NVY96004.1 PTS N-acetylglucosamine transporter subunit IIBC [Bombilactobacillus apium]
MRKVLFASHHRLASGLKDTLDYIAPNAVKVQVLDAYLTNVAVTTEIEQALADVDWKNDEVLVFTDLLGGSVNQNFTKYLSQPHFHLLAGMNLPLALSLLLTLPKGYLEKQQIRTAVQEARQQLVYVNDVVANMEADEDDE